MKKIRLELMRPYITNILSTLTTVEDEVMVEYVFSQLEEKQHPDGKLIQIMMTGFLGKTKARTFMGELWSTLLEAQTSPHGIPAELIELKREEMQKKKVSLSAFYCVKASCDLLRIVILNTVLTISDYFKKNTSWGV